MGLGGGPSTKAEAKPKVTKQAENAGKTLTLHPQSSTLNPKSSTLNLKASTCNPQSSTSNPQSATLNTQHSTLKPSTLIPQPSTLNTQILDQASRRRRRRPSSRPRRRPRTRLLATRSKPTLRTRQEGPRLLERQTLVPNHQCSSPQGRALTARVVGRCACAPPEPLVWTVLSKRIGE